MRIIFSRKGFDSSITSGGVPSPIFPDGRMLSLPIPDKNSPITYATIKDANGNSIGNIVENLTAGKKRYVKRDWKAHIDPDLASYSLDRHCDWLPIFGQRAAAQSHLKNQGVCEGDIFIFFGLYREVDLYDDGYRFVSDKKPKHIIFGWMQIGRICDAETLKDSDCYNYHPHIVKAYNGSNVLYIAGKQMKLKNNIVAPGAGVFTHYQTKLQLTAPNQLTSIWLLPSWFYPLERASSLSYHGDMSRWTPLEDCVLLKTVAKGQEFVLDCKDYPEAYDWLINLLAA